MKFIDHLFDSEKNIHWYHIGYASQSGYQEFYDWQCTKPLHYDHSDMPHDYFVYLNEADRLEMHEKFAEYIAPQEESEAWIDEWHNCTEVLDLNSIEYQLMTILNEEIQKEINREIIEKVNL